MTFWLGMGYECAVTPFECELVLRENGGEARQPHTFIGEVRPGTFVYMNDRDWIDSGGRNAVGYLSACC